MCVCVCVCVCVRVDSMCAIDYLTVNVNEDTYQVTRGGKVDGGTNEILRYSNKAAITLLYMHIYIDS